MTSVRTLFFIANAFSIFAYATQENIIIRHATLNDLNAIAELTRQTYYGHYKPFLVHMPAIIKLNKHIDDLIEEKLQQANNAARNFILKHENNEPYGILVVYNENDNALMGYCRFNKKDSETLYIYSIAIDKKFQRMGLGSQLLSATIKLFDDITSCRLRAFVTNYQAHNFYEKYGFKNIDTIAIDLVTGDIISDQTVPPTHIDYMFVVTK